VVGNYRISVETDESGCQIYTGGDLMIDRLSDLRQRYQKALQVLAKEMRLPESVVTQIIGDLGSTEKISNLRKTCK